MRTMGKVRAPNLDSMTGAIMAAEGLDQFDPLIEQAKALGARIAQTVAANNYKTLYGFGQKVSAQAIYTTTSFLPKPVQDYIQPGYVEPPPSPKWVQDIMNPLTAPIVIGARDKALEAAHRIATPAYLGGLVVILTLFGFGYIVGRVAGGRICALERA